MYISQVVCSFSRKRGITALELTVAVIIIGIALTISARTWQKELEKEYSNNAILYLNSTWQAEQNYFAWKNTFTNNWTQLEIAHPETADRFYRYTIENPSGTNETSSTLSIKAARRNQTSKYFTIDQAGTIRDETGHIIYQGGAQVQ